MSGGPLKLLLRSALDLLYPPHCESCQEPISQGFLCRGCMRRIRWIRSSCCHVCSIPLSMNMVKTQHVHSTQFSDYAKITASWSPPPVYGCISKTYICTNCRLRKFHFQFAVCACEAEDVVRRLIHRFKYHGVMRLEGILSQLLCHAWRDVRIAAANLPPKWLVPVPLYPLRERERGFNQARILAEALSKHTGIACRSFLKRSYSTNSQTLLTGRLRRQNLQGAFASYHNQSFHGTHVMLVDDVFTTGSTLEECAKTLLQGGAHTVSAITVARAV
jgi:competence protein ComFC